MSEAYRRPATEPRAVLRQVAMILVAALVLAVIGAVLWSQLVDLPRVMRTRSGADLPELQLSRIVNIDGWYTLLAIVGGLALGLWATARSGLDEVARVLVLTGAAALAGWVMLQLGLLLGPPAPGPLVGHLRVGQSVAYQLRPHSGAVPFVWPGAALVGCLAVLVGRSDPRRQAEPEPAAAPEPAGRSR